MVHVSAPYKKTEKTRDSTGFFFVLMALLLSFQIFRRRIIDTFPISILRFISSLEPPELDSGMGILWFITSLVLPPMFVVQPLHRLQSVYEWRSLDFNFPSRSFEESVINSGRYIPGNSVPLDVDSADDGRVWITIPRLLRGVPATLATLNGHPGDASPVLEPYPSWGWHHEGDCNGMTSVFRVQVDRCGRLWVPDTGKVDVLGKRTQICPPTLLIFDTVLDQLSVRYTIPPSQRSSNTLIVNIAVDITATCHDAVAYMADVTGFRLIAYSLRDHTSWRIESNYFYPYPRWGYFRIAGSEFDLMDGVIGLALSPTYHDGDKILYFHSLASDSESWVRASVLRDNSNFFNGTNRRPRSFRLFPGTRQGQVAAQAMDDEGILFFSLLSTNSLVCWNSRLPYSQSRFVELERDNEALQFASGVKIVHRNGYQELWVLTSRLQKVITGTLNRADINFRILRAPVSFLVQGTPCDVQFDDDDESLLDSQSFVDWDA
ncbi:protein yellow [Anabrus simplex]|uniref:protein yellow n=1 Tax=Anabrus simplex TaxID=316456 RepID=UPI0035A28C9C